MVKLFDIGSDVINTDHLRNLDQLVIIVYTLKEGRFAEHHPGEHAPCRPDIKLIVVVFVPKQQLRCFVVLCRDPDVEGLTRVVEVGQAPVDNRC